MMQRDEYRVSSIGCVGLCSFHALHIRHCTPVLIPYHEIMKCNDNNNLSRLSVHFLMAVHIYNLH